MSEVLLLNPRGRRKPRRRNPSAAQLRARAKFAAAARARSRRANPSTRRAVVRASVRANPSPAPYENPRRRRRGARRRNPALLRAYRSARRRRNPIGGLNTSRLIDTLKGAAVQGVGAVGMDMLYGYIGRMLPSNLQAGPGQLTAGSALKAVLTAALGQLLDRPTKGLASKAAMGSLTVQFRDVAAGFLPTLVPGMAGRLGYATPASRVVNANVRVGPNRTSLGAYTGARPPLLNAYTAPGVTPMLSGSARMREVGVR
jgi:hypothetical protein